MSKNELLINPNTNTHSFGKIPEIKYRNDYFQCGEIYLKQGEHRGINRGFGAEHIWEAHKKQLITLGYNSIEDVPKFISNIIRLKAPIHCEFDNIRGKHRISVITSSIGVAYLEERHDGNNDVFYSARRVQCNCTVFPKPDRFQKGWSNTLNLSGFV